MAARDASIETVGYASPDTLVPLALLRALYLPPAMLKPARPQARRTASTTSDSAQASSEAGPSSRVVFEPLRKHHPGSPSLDWIRSPAGLIVPSSVAVDVCARTETNADGPSHSRRRHPTRPCACWVRKNASVCSSPAERASSARISWIG